MHDGCDAVHTRMRDVLSTTYKLHHCLTFKKAQMHVATALSLPKEDLVKGEIIECQG